ncbi:GDP-L-fucose synthase family protein [Bacteroidota bacterium]
MKKDSKIYIAGETGMVGSAILRNLKGKGFNNFIFYSYPEFDLINQKDTEEFFKKEKPEYVFVAAAKVGGIMANNTYRAEFIYENLMIQNNIIHFSYKYGVKKLLFLGSSCIYPKNSPQPMKEEYMLTGELEPTNEPYAIAKIAGIKMCESYFKQYKCDFISVMPTNLYGPGDNYDLSNSHVLPALIRKFHEAKINKAPSVEIWGSGKPKREFMYVEDMAEACLMVMQKLSAEELYNHLNISHLNIGTGNEISISELSLLIANIIDYKGSLKYNTSKPDGMLKKRLDVSRLGDLGYEATTGLEEGIRKAYQEYKARQK